MDDAYLNLALKALADRRRFRILREVVDAGELTCGQIGEALPVAQPTVSHHIHVLVEAGLLTLRRSGQQTFVTVDRDALEAVPRLLAERLFGPRPAAGRDTVLEISRPFEAPAERVYDAWLDPAAVADWMFPAPSDTVEEVRIDPRVGSTFNFRVRRGREVIEHVGEYLELCRPERLAFTWCFADEEARSRVAVAITPSEEGCTLTLRHTLDPDWADEAPRIERVWQGMLTALSKEIDRGTASGGYGRR
ncbi:MAG: metalloregulator ArsR/SmtB family transcription factor [Deltaproteobacteria bacterium]|nr:metalloregulator ArsR/SmtB family transcription factor [Deltaproteobacteria bacterium]